MWNQSWILRKMSLAEDEVGDAGSVFESGYEVNKVAIVPVASVSMIKRIHWPT